MSYEYYISYSILEQPAIITAANNSQEDAAAKGEQPGPSEEKTDVARYLL